MAEETNHLQYKAGRGVPVIRCKDSKCDLCGCGSTVWVHQLSDGSFRKSSQFPDDKQLPRDKIYHSSSVYKFGSLGNFCVFCKFPETFPTSNNQLVLEF